MQREVKYVTIKYSLECPYTMSFQQSWSLHHPPQIFWLRKDVSHSGFNSAADNVSSYLQEKQEELNAYMLVNPI